MQLNSRDDVPAEQGLRRGDLAVNDEHMRRQFDPGHVRDGRVSEAANTFHNAVPSTDIAV